ncbi:DUF4198 domain-containing protein [Thauera linaloolentis]|uniref:Nickel transport complex transmembrane protein NikM n=1 Tax=Thauera linaloolentis (strain DSM 12138 / JCM 21573 / CCUG 41526 / CIP 105981 / IAM 15112 / NBRC 102519 / 47Lol) TaxID=1123367 RepID=N6Z1Y4_THAL4|nr:DUF4198 domain-containing protein [Thauera linaloolentis]ENO88627.1 nickel transport complex transmembrane protein NikM [Thauera linaloolentis 47Lol = DSM 12138]MCM8565672.1 DUF4198 domain-containing protein [Thauera linaloolentis]
MKLNKHLAAAALGLAIAAPAAQAHEFWLLPSSTVLSSPGYITVDAAVSNDIFYFNYRPLGIRDNLVISAPDGSTVAPESLTQGKLRTVFDANLQATGTYRLAIANSSLMASWKENGETKRWRGTHAEMAEKVPANAQDLVVREGISRLETFVTVGRPSEIKPTGKGLELLPVTHPNDLYEGSPAVFTFVVDGKPAAGVEVEMIRAGTRYRDQLEKITLVTNADGQVSYTWKEPGMYYVKTGVTGKSDTMENVERRLSYVTTLEVLAQ